MKYCKSRIFHRHVIFVYFARGGFRTKVKCMRKVQNKSENLQQSATVRKFHAYERSESPGYENWVRTKYSGFTVQKDWNGITCTLCKLYCWKMIEGFGWCQSFFFSLHIWVGSTHQHGPQNYVLTRNDCSTAKCLHMRHNKKKINKSDHRLGNKTQGLRRRRTISFLHVTENRYLAPQSLFISTGVGRPALKRGQR